MFNQHIFDFHSYYLCEILSVISTMCLRPTPLSLDAWVYIFINIFPTLSHISSIFSKSSLVLSQHFFLAKHAVDLCKIPAPLFTADDSTCCFPLTSAQLNTDSASFVAQFLSLCSISSTFLTLRTLDRAFTQLS